uniref:Reverse transcriptase zinc-binding domain-containing protein n=1 Tax=Lactuca sativa TaxID=4236 RepID=A0A9R1X8Q1_LACSA|nr:hypothetical protein LSAT_V11C500287670 [Lactuca sativa]
MGWSQIFGLLVGGISYGGEELEEELRLNRIHVRSVLVDRGVEMESSLFPICQSEVESVSHLFFQCETACQIWRRLGVWLDVSFPIGPGVSEMFDWIYSLVVVCRHRSIWIRFAWRVYGLFGLIGIVSSLALITSLYDTIVDLSFRWFSLRKSKACVSWIDCMCNPLMT